MASISQEIQMTGTTIKACRSVLLVGMLLAFAALAADSSSAVSPIVVRKYEEMRDPVLRNAIYGFRLACSEK